MGEGDSQIDCPPARGTDRILPGFSCSFGDPEKRKETRIMGQRELNEPHKGDKRYQRRNEDGTFGESDDMSQSLGQDVRQHSGTKKPRNEGDRGD
jgi:hypothetical protein